MATGVEAAAANGSIAAVMQRISYEVARFAVRFVGGMAVRHVVVHGERLRRAGPFVLACTHAGHLEPALIAGLMRRPVHWVARREFFNNRPAALAMRQLGAISVDRRGTPVRAIRETIRRLGSGAIVGIFPEGGRTHGPSQAVHGGPVKGGACAIALRSGVPIVPVVVLGMERLHAVTPWLPGQRTTIRTIVGAPMLPGPPATRTDRRSRRRAMTADLAAAFMSLHAELQTRTGGGA